MRKINALIALLPLLPLLAAQSVNTGNHRKIFTASVAPAAPCAPSITGRAGDYWAGNYSSSPITTNWTDSSAFNNPMGPSNSPTWASNTFGTARAGVTLNGTNQFFSATNAQFPNNNFTNFSAYAVISMPPGGGGSFAGNHNGDPSLIWTVTQGSPGTVSLAVQGSAPFCTDSTQTFTAGTAYEVDATYDGTTCTFYHNGTSVFTASSSHVNFTGMDRILTTNGSTGFFKGSIYELVFSSSATYQSAIHACWVGYGLP